MYLKEKNIKLLQLKNTICTIIGVFSILMCGNYIVSEFTYYRDDLNTALNAVSMKSSILWFIIGTILLITVNISRNRIKNATFYSSYFEGDLDGYVAYRSLAEITGLSIKKVRRQLYFYRICHMKNYKLKEENGEGFVELHSKKCLCECKNCGAHIEKRIFFTGICPYCSSSDLFAKVITDNQFYNISSDFKSGMKRPDYYTDRKLNVKKALSVTLLMLCTFIAIVSLMMTLDETQHYFDQEYQKEILFSPENHLSSYALIKADILDSIIFGLILFLIFMPLAISMLRKTITAFRAGICANFFAKCQTPLVKTKEIHDFGIMSGRKMKLKAVRSSIRRGYLIHCTLEIHNSEPMVALAKKIVKDQCPSCGAPIVGAVDENYVCQYCHRLIMGVIEKK